MAGGSREWVSANDTQRAGNIAGLDLFSPRPVADLIQQTNKTQIYFFVV